MNVSNSGNGGPNKIVILNGRYDVNANVTVNSSNSGKVYLIPNGTEETDTNVDKFNTYTIYNYSDATGERKINIRHSNIIRSVN